MPVDWPRFAELVKSASRFVLTSHVRPDCDALGSELGMAAILETLGKDVLIVNGQTTPPVLEFIDPDRKLRTIGVDIQEADLADREVFLVLDTSAWAQLGPMADVMRASKARKAIVDHHVGQDDLGAELFKDVTAEATGRLVVEAAEALGVKLTPQMATPLFAAVATDTGWFRFGSASSETYRVGARLIDAGAKPSAIYNQLYEQETVERVRLRGLILARTVIEMEGRLVWTMALSEDFAATGALAQDTEDVVNLTLNIAGTQVALIFVELASGGMKVSFRSRSPNVDCNQLASKFGGGGHKAAAGATIKAPRDEVTAMVLDAVRAALR